MKTIEGSPAADAYAATDALVLPVEAQATIDAPTHLAWLTPTVMPRSLNEPVGFSPSCLNQTSTPAKSLSRLSWYRFVLPSGFETITSSGMSGISSRKRQTPERSGW